MSMNLQFINSSKLNDFEKEKHSGSFVYLNKEYETYKPGLYFGGENGWEKLSNNISGDELIINTSNKLPLPSQSNVILVYNGTKQTYLPTNWDVLSSYCSITNNKSTDVGTYTCNIEIISEGRYWIDDDTTNIKNITFEIKPMYVTDCVISISKDSIIFGEDNPVVTSVAIGGKELVKNVDYSVVNPSNNQCGEKTLYVNFKGNYTGTLTKNYTINQKEIELPDWTNVQLNMEYDGTKQTITPSNWDEIKNDCYITDNNSISVGDYTSSIILKDEVNTIWKDGTKSSQTKQYSITPKTIDIPNWGNLIDVYEFNGNYITILPTNWEEISQFCDITNNTKYEAGNYEVVVSLKSLNYTWYIGDNENKTRTFSIIKKRIPNPAWESVYDFKFDSHLHSVYPTNWNPQTNQNSQTGEFDSIPGIGEFCFISGNLGIDVGNYNVEVTLRDEKNTEWENGNINTTQSFEISQADGYFPCDVILIGSENPNENLTAHCKYIDETAEITYTWYRSVWSLEQGSIIQSGKDENTYQITYDDYDRYIYVEVKAESTKNYKGTTSIIRTQKKIAKIPFTEFGFKLKSYTIKDEYSYQLPELNIPEEMLGSTITYEVVKGNDIVKNISSDGVITINENWTGTVVVKATIISQVYNCTPNNDFFTLTVTCGDIVYYGMYNNMEAPTLMTKLENGEFPDNIKQADIIKQNGKLYFTIRLSEFNKNYNSYGWYILVK